MYEKLLIVVFFDVVKTIFSYFFFSFFSFSGIQFAIITTGLKSLQIRIIIFIYPWFHENIYLHSTEKKCTLRTPPRPMEISKKNWSTKVQPFLTSHLWYKALLKIWRKSRELLILFILWTWFRTKNGMSKMVFSLCFNF